MASHLGKRNSLQGELRAGTWNFQVGTPPSSCPSSHTSRPAPRCAAPPLHGQNWAPTPGGQQPAPCLRTAGARGGRPSARPCRSLPAGRRDRLRARLSGGGAFVSLLPELLLDAAINRKETGRCFCAGDSQRERPQVPRHARGVPPRRGQPQRGRGTASVGPAGTGRGETYGLLHVKVLNVPGSAASANVRA